MKKKIAILGSTGSIGKTLIEIIKENKKNFEIVLLTADKNYKEIFKQAKSLNVKNLILTDKKSFDLLKKKNIGKINIFNNYNSFNNIFKKKIDYAMSSISGIDGLEPTLKIIKHTKKIAIANKEAIICGWHLIKKNLKEYKTTFVPVDSEHFSIFYALKSNQISNIEKIYLTASGGPLNNLPKKRFKNIKISEAIKHPNWKMGKKISIDSATLINKIFELIEAKKIFSIEYSKFKLIIQPTSYVHAVVDFNNGVSKILTHPTSMKIPIYNSLNDNFKSDYFSNKMNLELINNLNFQEINKIKFPIDKIIRLIPNNDSLFETVLVSANDTLVDLFLKKKIKFFDIYKYLIKILSLNEFKKFKTMRPKNLDQITVLSRNVRLKTISLSVRSQN